MIHAHHARAALPAAVILGITSHTAGQSMVFTIDHAPITGTPDEPQVFEFDFPFHGPSASHDLVVLADMHTPSFGSELNIIIRHESGFEIGFDGSDSNTHDLGPADFELGFGDAAGPWEFQGALDFTGVIHDMHGSWTISVFDEFDSLPGPEGTLFMQYTVWVPSPAAGTALMLSGVCLVRRHR